MFLLQHYIRYSSACVTFIDNVATGLLKLVSASEQVYAIIVLASSKI